MRTVKLLPNDGAYLTKNGVVQNSKGGASYIAARDFNIWTERQAGKTLALLGKEYNISQERVRQIQAKTQRRVDWCMLHKRDLVEVLPYNVSRYVKLPKEEVQNGS